MRCGRVVIIEDDDSIRETLQQVIELEGYQTLTFSNGKEALEGLKGRNEGCLILLDLMMPVMSGWEFLTARRDFDATIVSLPVVIVSAAGPATETAMVQDNVRAYVKKPIDMDILLDIVEHFCGPLEKNKID
jgi:DNA-binding NtrC family response regulator